MYFQKIGLNSLCPHGNPSCLWAVRDLRENADWSEYFWQRFGLQVVVVHAVENDVHHIHQEVTQLGGVWPNQLFQTQVWSLTHFYSAYVFTNWQYPMGGDARATWLCPCYLAVPKGIYYEVSSVYRWVVNRTGVNFDWNVVIAVNWMTEKWLKNDWSKNR